jgi:hypothetical protein
MKKTITVLSLVWLACTVNTAPGSSSSGAAAAGGNGVTSCGNFPDMIAKSCQAGQYCDDEGFSKCLNGCLSDTNCASNQTCEKASATKVGNCINKTTPTATSCTDLCKKAIGCKAQTTQPMCEAACLGLTEACKACVISKPCNAPDDACDAECK